MAFTMRLSRAKAVAKPMSVSVRTQRPVYTISRMPVHSRDVRVCFFKFGKNGMGSEDAGIYGSQNRDDYCYDDVEHYFNYMGMLAVEGTYDRMEEMLKSGLHPVDVLLLMACSENDTPKVEELLRAGANVKVTDNNGKSPLELCTKEDIKAMLQKAPASV